MVRLKDVANRAEVGILTGGFNSIVVRLKAAAKEATFLGGNRFNSIVVRLKVLRLGRGNRRDREFQFHSGSIKSSRRAGRGEYFGGVSIP